jgi:hypothetical protein
VKTIGIKNMFAQKAQRLKTKLHQAIPFSAAGYTGVPQLRQAI